MEYLKVKAGIDDGTLRTRASFDRRVPIGGTSYPK